MSPSCNMVAVGFAMGGLLSVLLIVAAPRWGWVDRPDQNRKCHQRPVALTGGLALWGVLALSHLLGWLPWPLHSTDWLGIHAMALMGALDDRFDLRARHKALVGLLVAALLAASVASGLYHAAGHVKFLSVQLPTYPIVTFPLLLFWMWSIPQAYNLIDGVNGLSTGLAFLVLGALGWHLGAQAMVVWGALGAVFLLNFPRAEHFLGDCGAMLLGTLFAILSVRLLVAWNANLLLWIFAYPIVDVTMVVSIRAWNHQPLGGADRSHLHHWMMDHLGNRAWLATPLLLGLAVLPMLRATDLAWAGEGSLAGGLGILGLAAKAFWDRTRKRAPLHPNLVQLRRNRPLIRSAETSTAPGSQRAS